MSIFSLSEKLIFSMEGKGFQFNMSDCHKVKYGFCPIEQGYFDTLCRCTELLQELERTNWVFDGNLPIVVYHKDCGHFSCVDGQHRLCIAGKLHKEVEIEKVCDAAWGICSYCEPLGPDTTDCKTFLEVF